MSRTCLTATHNALTHPTGVRLTLVFAQSFGLSLFSMMQTKTDPLWNHQSLTNKLLLSGLIAGLATMTYSHVHAAIKTHQEHPQHTAKKVAHVANVISAAAFIAFGLQRVLNTNNDVNVAQVATLLTGVIGFLTQACAHTQHNRQTPEQQRLDHFHHGMNIAASVVGLGFATFVVLKAAGFDLAGAINVGDDALKTSTRIAGQVTLGMALSVNIVDSLLKHRNLPVQGHDDAEDLTTRFQV